MPGRLRGAPPRKTTAATPTGPAVSGLDALIERNPHLSLADILALWHWTGPSSRIH